MPTVFYSVQGMRERGLVANGRVSAVVGRSFAVPPSSRPTRIRSHKDIVAFLHYDTGDGVLASFLGEIIEKIGYDGYVEVKRGGEGKPYFVEYGGYVSDGRHPRDIQSEVRALKNAFDVATTSQERDLIERGIAELVGGYCCVWINTLLLDDFDKTRSLILHALKNLKIEIARQ